MGKQREGETESETETNRDMKRTTEIRKAVRMSNREKRKREIQIKGEISRLSGVHR